MGNNSTKKEDIVIPYHEYLQKLREHQTLQSDYKESLQLVDSVRKQNEELRRKINEIELEKDANYKEFVRYDSLPFCKNILNLYDQITKLEEEMKDYLNKENLPNQNLVDEVQKLRKNVNEQRQNMGANYLQELPDMKTEKLEELQRALSNSVNFSRNDKQDSLSDGLEKLHDMKEEISNSMNKISSAIERNLAVKRAIFNDIKSDHVNVKYEEMKNILLQQENILLTHRVNMLAAGNIETPKTFKHNIESPRENNLIFCYVVEEHVDRISDYTKVNQILSSIGCHSHLMDLKLTRLGRMMDRPRKIKVMFSNADYVGVVLRNKHKLKDGPFSAIRIFPDKPNNASS